MNSTKYIGLDVHKESISIAVMNSVGKVVMECVIETKASTILRMNEGGNSEIHYARDGDGSGANFEGPRRSSA